MPTPSEMRYPYLGWNRSPMKNNINNAVNSSDQHLILLACVFLILWWPRYFFISLAGKGVSPFSLGMLFLEIGAIYRIMTYGVRFVTAGQAINILLSSFLIWTFVCDFAGSIPGYSLSVSFRTYIYLYGGYLVGVAFISQTKVLKGIPTLICVLVIISAAIAVLERATTRSFLSFSGLERFMVNSSEMELLLDGTFRDGLFRSAATFSHPIIFSDFLAASAGFAIHVFMNPNWLKKLVGGLALGAIPVGIYLANSRSGYLVLLISLTCFGTLIVYRKFKSKSILWLGGIGAIVIIAATSIFADYIKSLVVGTNGTEMGSTEARALQMQIGFSALSQSPIVGFGEGMSGLKAGLVGEKGVVTIDNTYLSILLDFGYVGLSLFVALMLSCVWGAWSAFYRSASPQAQSRSAAIVAFTVSIVIGQSAASIYDNLLPVFMLAGACVGMPILPVKHRSTGGRGSNGSGFGKLDSGLERRPEEVNR